MTETARPSVSKAPEPSSASSASSATSPRRWLVKTEPGVYSFDDLRRDRRTAWEGVANALALIHLRGMQRGDPVIVYHTGNEKSVVGFAEVVKGPYADPALTDPKRVVVDLAAVAPAESPVPIAALRSEPSCKDLALFRIPRLSVMPVSDAAWTTIERLAKRPPDAKP